MKKTSRLLLIILALGIQWQTAHAVPYDDRYLDKLLDSPNLVEDLRNQTATYKKASGYRFNPDDLSLIGALSRREYEREIQREPVDIDAALKNFKLPSGGHILNDDILQAHRFETIMKYTHRRMRNVYQRYVLEKPVRVINNVGGVYAIMEIYSCSAKEYVAMYGTQLKQSGYSGTYRFMKVYDVMVDGLMKSHGIEHESSLPVAYGPGEISLLEKKDRRYYDMAPGSMMLDYGRGFIVPAFWYGVIVPYLGHGDGKSFGNQISQCFKSMAKSRLSRNEEE